jgi:hypothetical protein
MNRYFSMHDSTTPCMRIGRPTIGLTFQNVSSQYIWKITVCVDMCLANFLSIAPQSANNFLMSKTPRVIVYPPGGGNKWKLIMLMIIINPHVKDWYAAADNLFHYKISCIPIEFHATPLIRKLWLVVCSLHEISGSEQASVIVCVMCYLFSCQISLGALFRLARLSYKHIWNLHRESEIAAWEPKATLSPYTP